MVRKERLSVKVLYLTYDGLTDPLGRSQILPYLLELCKLGAEFTIISFEKKERKADKKTITDLIGKAKINWIPLDYHKTPPVISTIRDVRKMKTVAFREAKNTQFEIVHCRSYISSIVGLELKKELGIKFVFDMRGYWADERVDGKLWNLKNPIYNVIYKYFKRKEKSFLLNANQTVALTKISKDHLSDNYGLDNIRVIPCCTDTQLFNPDLIEPPSEDMYIGYLGSMGTWYMIEEMVRFVGILFKRNSDLKWLIITGDNTDILINSARKYEVPLDRIEIIKADRNEVPKYLMKMDIMLMFIMPVFSKSASSPTKLGEALSMNIPVIANNNVGDVETIIKDSQGGIVLKRFDEGEYNVIAEQVNLLLTSSIKQETHDWVKNNLSLKMGVDRYMSVYENC